MKKRTFALAPLVAAASVLTGCGGDSSTGNGADALTSDEAYALASEFFTLLQEIDIAVFDNPTPSSPAAVPYGEVYDDQIDVNEACDGGGNATIVGSISGDVDMETGDADLDVAATADFAGCGIVGETSTITVTGDPDVDITAHILVSDAAASLDLDGLGSVSYTANDGREGQCGVDLSTSVALTSTGLTQTLTGTMCGVDAGSFDLQLVNP